MLNLRQLIERAARHALIWRTPSSVMEGGRDYPLFRRKVMNRRINRSLKFVSLLGVLVMLALSLGACPATPKATPRAVPVAITAPERKLAVGIVLPTKDEPRWVQDETRFLDAFRAAEYGVQILFSQDDRAKEKANVESLIAQGVKVLIICPVDGIAAAAAAEEAHAAGVKVIAYNRLIRDTAAVDYYVTFDSVAVGKAQAQYLVDHAQGKNNPLYLYAGVASDNNAFLFFQGAWETLQPKIVDGTFVIKNSSEAVALQGKATLTRDEEAKIINQVTTNWDFDTAKNLAESNLKTAEPADKGTVLILAPNDVTARAIADVFGADKAIKTYYITGQDAEIMSLRYIIDGKQSMTVEKDDRTLVRDASAAAVTFLEGKLPEKTTTYNNGKIDVPAKPSDIVTITQDNAMAILCAQITDCDWSPGVGIVLPTRDEPRWIQDETRFNEGFKAAEADVRVLFSRGDSAQEKANVERLISGGIKVLILCPVDGTAAAAAAEEARAAGVKVIAYDRLIRDTSAVDYYVTFDAIAVGQAQAQYLIDHAQGQDNPLYLYAGARSDNDAFLYFQGAWETLQPKIADGTFVIRNSSEAVALQAKPTLTREEMAKVIGQVTTDWDSRTAGYLAESNLAHITERVNKDHAFILAPNDVTARAVADAFAADPDIRSYVITGQDAEKTSVQYILDGKQSMTVFKDVRTLVKDAVVVAVAYLKGEMPEATASYNNGKIEVPAKPSAVVTVTKDNLWDALGIPNPALYPGRY
jgi:ABC-type xylose transport system substrate-binding protein